MHLLLILLIFTLSVLWPNQPCLGDDTITVSSFSAAIPSDGEPLEVHLTKARFASTKFIDDTDVDERGFARWRLPANLADVDGEPMKGNHEFAVLRVGGGYSQNAVRGPLHSPERREL